MAIFYFVNYKQMRVLWGICLSFFLASCGTDGATAPVAGTATITTKYTSIARDEVQINVSNFYLSDVAPEVSPLIYFEPGSWLGFSKPQYKDFVEEAKKDPDLSAIMLVSHGYVVYPDGTKATVEQDSSETFPDNATFGGPVVDGERLDPNTVTDGAGKIQLMFFSSCFSGKSGYEKWQSAFTYHYKISESEDYKIIPIYIGFPRKVSKIIGFVIPSKFCNHCESKKSVRNALLQACIDVDREIRNKETFASQIVFQPGISDDQEDEVFIRPKLYPGSWDVDSVVFDYAP